MSTAWWGLLIAICVFLACLAGVTSLLLGRIAAVRRSATSRIEEVVSHYRTRVAVDLADLEDRMITRILVGEALIRVQTDPASPLSISDVGLAPALSFGSVEALIYRSADYAEPLLCCHHGGPLVQGGEFYLIPLLNAPDPDAVLAVCMDCHEKEKRRALEG